MQTKIFTVAMVALVLVGGWTIARGLSSGDEYGDLDVRTYQLEYMEPNAAYQIIDPYVFGNRGGTVSGEEQSRTLTVRETPEMLDRIAEVLQRYDKPDPSANLHFRLVEANGGGPSDDARVEEIAEALPQDVFKFQNYRLIGETVMTGIEWSGLAQGVAAGGERYHIEVSIGEIRETEGGGSVKLEVSLLSDQYGQIFRTAVNAQIGQLVVLGSAQPDPDRGSLILAVRVDLVR
jgi:hypothetical protein